MNNGNQTPPPTMETLCGHMVPRRCEATIVGSTTQLLTLLLTLKRQQMTAADPSQRAAAGIIYGSICRWQVRGPIADCLVSLYIRPRGPRRKRATRRIRGGALLRVLDFTGIPDTEDAHGDERDGADSPPKKRANLADRS